MRNSWQSCIPALCIACTLGSGSIEAALAGSDNHRADVPAFSALRADLAPQAVKTNRVTSVFPPVGNVTEKAPQVLFDDFNYSSYEELAKNGWIIRTAPGWPGMPGVTWRKEGVSLLEDPDLPGNRILRMISSTDGTGANTSQTQICHERKYMDGTYGARVKFMDDPDSGPAGDQLVESFYAISPLKAPMDPDYSELDFEYLPNGGWGSKGPTLYVTTWRTFSPEPNWKKDNVSFNTAGKKAGWHVLVMQVSSGKVKYFIDGKALAEHGGQYYPRSVMSINFNLWFIKDGAVKATELRQYHEDIDWVFYEARSKLSTADIEAKVAGMRRTSVKFRDTVPAPVPALTSPCNF